jgi:hypothetical protein
MEIDQHHTQATAPTGNNPDTHLYKAGWEVKTGLDFLEKNKSLVSNGIRTSNHPARTLVQAPLATNTT